MIEHISTTKGLSHRHVHCVMEDSYGFLWIGTDDGLNRYDGYEFVVYKNDVWDSTSLSSPIVKQLVEDNNGNIWVGTSSGLNFYQRKSDSFIRYTHNPENKFSISNNDNIESIQIDKTNPNYIWVGTDGGGLNLLDISLQRFYVFKLDTNNISSLSGNKILSLYQDSFNDFWIGTSDAGLNKINLNSIPKLSNGKYDVSKFGSIKFERYVPGQSNSDKFNPSFTNSFYEDNSGRLWILTYPHALMFDREKNIIHSIPNSEFDKTHFHEMIEDEKGNFWFGEHNRVFRLVAGKNILDEYKLNEEKLRSMSNQGLCEDGNGNIWVATWDGIYKISEEVSPFERYIYNLGNSSTPAGNYIYSILADQSENIWIGTNSGLLLMVKGDNGIVRFTNYYDLHQLEIESVESIVQDRKGLIWLTSNYTLLRIDPKNNLIMKYKNNQDNSNCLSFQQKLNWKGPTNLHIDNNNLWIAAYRGGISKVSLEDLYSSNDMNNVHFTNYFNDSDHPACTVQNFIQDRYGYLWICSQNGGVFMFDPEKEIVKNFNQDFNHTQSLSINYVTSVLEDKKGNLWFGTYGGGLNRFDRESESFTHFSIKDGLPSDIISGILEDDNGNLWISTNQGITKFNTENNKIRNYDVQENEVSFRDTITGKMYFGNKNGFIIFHPDSIKESSYVPSVVLTKFTRYSDENDGEQIIDRTISAKKNIELSYKDDIISFEFAALSFDKNFNCKYSYKLEGFSNNWINVGTKREVTFTNLDPGDYTFKVKACNEDGIWCSNYASFKLYISPPWWATWWSYGIYGLLFISALYVIRRFELDRRKEKEEKRILGLENERKTKELNQARKLQLSMLPDEIPSLQNLDIAVYMKTATEVGGDYYDFCRSEDGNYLTAVLGDATGHGMNAGMMVSISKGLFKNLAQQPDLQYVISQFNSSLLSMELQPMYMSLCFLRIIYNELQLVGAGMPPSLFYQSKKNTVIEIESSGPPLGGFVDFNYELCKYEIAKGDIIVLLSDGFAERMNEKKELLGWDKGRELLSEVKDSTAHQIIKQFIKASDEWGGDRPQDDDLTLLVIKVK